MTAVRLSQVFLVCSYFKKVLSKSKFGLIHDNTTQNMNNTQVSEPSRRLENRVWHSEVDVWKEQHICMSLGTEIIMQNNLQHEWQ